MPLHKRINLLINDVQKCYIDYRMMGKSRDDAIAAVKSFYTSELLDSDDCVWVLIGLSLSLCKKKELTSEIATETRNAIQAFRQYSVLDDAANNYFVEVEQNLFNVLMYGDEAAYKQRTKYIPKWEIGDVFSHRITHPSAEQIGILGWAILFYKIGEFVDEFQKHRQLMFVSLCPPDKEPVSSTELQKLGFLRIMRHNEKWDYLVQITPKSKQDERQYELSKIGNFPDILPPSDWAEEDPVVSMPLFGRLRKCDTRPAYEDQICRVYKRFYQKQ